MVTLGDTDMSLVCAMPARIATARDETKLPSIINGQVPPYRFGVRTGS
jgi:hypothetical protein